MTWPRRLLNILTLRCAAASELASQAMDEPLMLPERLALHGHWLACSPCRRFRDQLVFLREACRRHDFQTPDVTTGLDALSTEAKARIARALRERDPGLS
jgi:hypothetical protein